MPHRPDSWNPTQYEKFRQQREAPGLDLLTGIKPARFQRGIDLGCGTGELTQRVQQALHVGEMLGTDNSESMLDRARLRQTESLRFERQAIETFAPLEEYDLVFSNAALNWCENHGAILAAFFRSLRPGGQLAIQMPANHDSLTHRLADRLASDEPYRSALNGLVRPTHVQTLEWYAQTLHRLGFREQRVELKVYPHLLDSREDVVEWVKGTLLTWYESRLSAGLFQHYLDNFRTRLFTELPDERPFFFPFKRLFLWAGK